MKKNRAKLGETCIVDIESIVLNQLIGAYIHSLTRD